MANYRTGRVNEELMKALCEIIRTVKDPRVSTSFISITAVDCTPDLKNAKVWYSVMGERRKGDTQKGLVNATGYIRTQIAKMLNLRITPELKFIPDESMKHGAHIAGLMKQVEEELREADRKAAEAEVSSDAEDSDAE
ncbi:MAG: 30S ribosome-binding factor RbfA [Clostridia bacterium]|nr:30S ribosome-binding factor RbfA [Clostridia bacterium]